MKKEKKTERKTFRERIADSLDVSKEVIMDVPRIEFLGNREVVIENYKAIAQYTREKIVLSGSFPSLSFFGEEMEIKSITREMLFISGKIRKMEFGEEEKGYAG